MHPVKGRTPIFSACSFFGTEPQPNGRFQLGNVRQTRIPTADPVSTCPLTYNDGFMTAYVYVSLKKSVLDPQGKTIQGALNKMGYKGLESVRQGKYFEITLGQGISREEAQTEVERIAREVLTNPVIEEFRFSFSE